MKKYSIYLILFLIGQIGFAQERSEIKVTKLRRVIDPLTQEKDKFNPVLLNETVEQFFYDEELQKIKREKLKLKLDNSVEKNYPAQPKATNPIEPKLGRNFQGLKRGMQPHDNGTAVGNEDFIVHSINSAIIITDLDGVESYSNSLKGFLGIKGTAVDPRIVFDPYEERWVAIAISSGIQGVYLAFSQTEDPNGKWNTYSIEIAGGGSRFYDYPHCGLTENELILTGKLTSGGGCYCIQVNKFDGYGGKDLKSREYKVNGPSNTAVVSTGRPDAKFGNKAYLLGSSGRGGTSVDLFTITDTVGGNPRLEKTKINVDRFSPGGNAPQKGGSALDGIDCRIYHTIYTQGKIHFVTHSDYQNTGFHAIMYGIINLKSNSADTYFFNKPKTDLQFPSIASFTSGEEGENMAIFFLEVNSQKYPGSTAILCDGDGNWSKPLTVKEGVGPISGGSSGRTRWGDYTSSARKYNAKLPTVWVSGEYGSNNGRSSWNAEITIDDLTGIIKQDFKPSKEVVVYPNPVDFELFTVEFNLDSDQNIRIGIYDLGGKFIESLYDARALKGKNKLMFNKKALGTGAYILRIRGEQSIIEQKKILIN